MQELFVFLGSHWWIVFPVAAMGMAIARRISGQRELSRRRRHREHLELLQMQAQLPASAPTPVEAPADGNRQRLLDAHDAVTHRWLEYELDASNLITYPAMSDGRQPLTAAFLRAKKVADGLRPHEGESITPGRLREYREAVTDYEVAFDVAERDARRVKDAAFTDAERKRLDTAKQLLTVATDQAATPNERQLAYKRVRDELDGLIWLSDGAVEELEKKVALELPRGDAPRIPPEPVA